MTDKLISATLVDMAGEKLNFTTLKSLLDFLGKESAFWRTQKDKIGNSSHSTMNCVTTLSKISSDINSWGDQVDEWDQNTLSQQVKQSIQNHSNLLKRNWLWSGHPFVENFIQCVAEHGESSANAFLEFLINKRVSNPQVADNFTGYLLAYEFINQDSQISKRRTGEKVSLGHLRAQFTQARDQLFSEAAKSESEIDKWSIKQQTDHKRLFSTQKRLGKRCARLQSKEFNQRLDAWSENIAILEKTYEEKLKLKKPAEYWAKAARRYGIQAGLWTLALVALVVVAAINFQEIFITWLQGKETLIQLSTIQGVIIFGTLAAVYAFLLRVLSRLAFSAFHLMRDAEEREQLTYLYLSLTNEAEMDKESRDIVLQALFSRTETGLLAQEHGPTMPGMHETLRAASRTRG